MSAEKIKKKALTKEYKMTNKKTKLVLPNISFEEAINKISLNDSKVKNQLSLF